MKKMKVSGNIRTLAAVALAMAVAVAILTSIYAEPSVSDGVGGLGFKAVSATDAEAFGIDNTITSASIPSTVDIDGKTYNVTRIAERGFSEYHSLKTISLPPTLKVLGAGVFESCTSLESVSIPNGILKLDVWTFYGCTGLKSVSIPESVVSVGDMSFYGCTNPELKVTVCKNNPNFASNASGQLIDRRDGTLLFGVNSEDAEIPSNIISICEWGFYGYDRLETLNIPDGVKFIGYSAFANCTSLMTVNIPKSVLVVGYDAFMGCVNPKLTFTVDPDNPYFYSEGGALYGKNNKELLFARNVENFTVAEGAKSVNTSAFNGFKNLKTVVLPEGMVFVGDFAFYGCTNLKSVTLPSTVREIRDSAFDGCSSLSSITVPDGTYYVGKSAFEGCSSLTDAVLPDSVMSIESSAFKGCASIKHFKIPENAAYLGKSAFDGCSSLKRIVIPAMLCSVEDGAFSGCSSVKSISFLGSKPVMKGNAFNLGAKGNVTVFAATIDDGLREGMRDCAGHVEFRDDCKISFECGKGGRMDAEELSSVKVGSIIPVSLTADGGYKIKDLCVNDIKVSGDGEYQVVVGSDAVIRAEFESTEPQSDMTMLIIAAVVAVIAVAAVAVVVIRRSRA